MTKYRNVTQQNVTLSNGVVVRPGEVVTLSENIAKSAGGSLQPVGTQTQTLLTEAPIGFANRA